MKYADCVRDTDRNRGGSKTLTGMLLNQINGLKLLHTSSSQCSGHHVQLRSHCIVGVEFFHIRGRSTRLFDFDFAPACPKAALFGAQAM